MSTPENDLQDAIAVVGMAVRFPGADSAEAFWRNLRNGTESLTVLSEEAMVAAGLPREVITQSNYVAVNGLLDGVEDFDAEFFGMSPREAELTDPQHRIFLELAWTAFERSGYDPGRTPGPVGVFAGAGMSTYLLRNLMPNQAVLESAGELPLLLGNNKDFVPTRASYKLDLRGPSINVNTACSTSLVATHLACQSLLDHHCDMALAGGVSVQVPQAQGYAYTEGGIGSPDGHCRAFDEAASGTVSGNGCGVVVLRRLDDALADGDHIHAVILGSAVNNDGADKAGFTAPSVIGQRQVIVEAQAVAGVEPTDISYVEAHGTGTPLGDPIEVAALTEAFSGVSPGSCAIGSVKTNFGHLDEAAGVAGLVKTALALEHGELPPSLHFHTPNPRIDFPNTPFFVNASHQPWPTCSTQPRIAGVSSFGIGGTNAHLVLREAPSRAPSPASDGDQLLILSARTLPALHEARANLTDWLAEHPDANLADVAFTLSQGRKPFAHRCSVVAADAAEAQAALPNSRGTVADSPAPDMVWLFSGQGSPYPGMLAGLYARESVVRETVDQCALILEPLLGLDIRTLLAAADADAAERLRHTALAQPIVFAADYALAQLWLSRGLKPAAMIGHSLGEYVAACLAGVFSLEAALALIVTRGQLMAAQPTGAMLAVGLGAEETAALAAKHEVDLAAVNAPNACVVSGPDARITALSDSLAEQGTAHTRLETSHAFHSVMMEPMMAAFGDRLRQIDLQPPNQTIISSTTGLPLTATQATDPDYWLKHLRHPVQFADAVQSAQQAWPAAIWLEVGPGRGLASMVKRGLDDADPARVFTTTRHASEDIDDHRFWLRTVGELWSAGVEFDWAQWQDGNPRRRVILPTYPFQRSRHWIEPPSAAATSAFSLATILPELSAEEAQGRADPTRIAHPRYQAFREKLDPWCAGMIFETLSPLWSKCAVGDATPIAELKAALRVIPAFEKCVVFLLHLLAEHGFGRVGADRFVWSRPAAPPPSSAELLTAFPEFKGIVRLVEHCLQHYPMALSGEIPAITVIYPDGKSDLLESTASETANHTDKRIYLQTLRRAIEEKVKHADGQPVRVLEVGIGDGLLAGELAPALRGRGVEYVATDLSQSFVGRAEAKAKEAGLDFLTFDVLDISRDPLAQGMSPESFDFVIGLDVVHATPRLSETLSHLRLLLKPGGCLGIVEKVRREPWVDLVWGLAEGWWYFADLELRPLSPLMAAERWEALLHALDFAQVEVLPRDGAMRQTTDYALLLAQTSTAPAVPVADWFQAVSWHERRQSILATAAEKPFSAADGLGAFITRANELGKAGGEHRLTLVSDGSPDQEMLTGALYTAAREYPQIECSHQIRLPQGGTLQRKVQPLATGRPEAFRVRESGVYIITGAFGSMGRVFARELARTTGVKLVLWGRRNPDLEWMHELETMGAEVMAQSVDVGDAPALTAALAAVHEAFGGINGVIHTAGVYGQGLMARREASAIADTLAPKVTGTRNLATAIADDPVDFLILCSSIAAVAPEPGQADYAAANAFLDAFARHHHTATGVPTLSIGWGVWQDLGMMEHASIPAAQKQAVRDEIEREGWQDIGSKLVRHILRCAAAQRHVLVSPRPVNLPSGLRHPLLRRKDVTTPGRTLFEVRLDPQTHWLVDDHRLAGLAVLPGTGYLELVRAAYTDLHDEGPVEFSDVHFLAPVTFPDNAPRELRIALQNEGFVVVSPLGEDRWQEHARGSIRRADPANRDRAASPRMTDPTEAPAADAVTFGPRWQNLKAVAFTDDAGVAELALPDDCHGDMVDYALHPALFDIAIGFITLRHGLADSLPFGYTTIRQYRPLPSQLRSDVTVVNRGPDHLELDARLFDMSGELLLDVSGYQLRVRPPQKTLATTDQARLCLRPDDPETAWRLVPAHRTAPAATEVEIEIETAGLNFIEVLYAHGMLPRSTELEDQFGLECAGRIVRVGPGVTNYQVGDPVLAYTNGCFASYVTVDQRRIARRPDGLTPDAAATLAGAYATAHYALVTSARLRAGETVLIHAAAGGVGLAAVNIAKKIGAVVYATAGSETKREFLREQGVAAVMDSRSSSFAEEVMRLTRNRGVDVVLNSLSGDLMRAGLKVVAPRGRFVELGKRDLFAGGSLDLSDFARIISFIVIDVGPDLPGFDELWHDVSECITDGSYPPLPFKSFPLTEAPAAFAFMAQAKHIGKVVLTPGDPAALLAEAEEAPPVGRALSDILGEPEPSHPKSIVPAPVESIAPASAEAFDLGFSDPIENAIAGIWRELLGVSQIGPDEDFFNLRGDSLLAAQVMARIQAELAVKLPLSTIFDAPTVAGLAQRVQALSAATTTLPDDEEEGEL